MKLRIIFLLALSLIPIYLAAEGSEKSLYVTMRESKLREQPQFWSTPVATLPYGTKLTVVGGAPSGKSWIKVKLDSAEGYVHVSAVTERRVVLASSKTQIDGKMDAGSVVLAGKGFNRQVEQSYASSKGLDFKPVDEVEQYKVESADEIAFLKNGKLSEN